MHTKHWGVKICGRFYDPEVPSLSNYLSVFLNHPQVPKQVLLSPLTSSSLFSFSSCRDDASAKATLLQHLVEDRFESASSYYEFLQHIQEQMSK